MGNGLLPGNKLAVIPMEQSCGQAVGNRTLPYPVARAPTQHILVVSALFLPWQPGVMFQMGLAMNPTSEIPSSCTQRAQGLCCRSSLVVPWFHARPSFTQKTFNFGPPSVA